MKARGDRLRVKTVMTMFALVIAMFITAIPAQANPPGNNGTIKIEGHNFDSGHDNDPHVSCDFSVEYFGYDTSTRTVDSTFWAWPPSASKPFVVTPLIGRTHFTFQGSGAGNALDHRELYRLPTNGMKAVNGQYHYKTQVHVSGSIGADTKYKTFWTGSCPVSTTTSSSTTTTVTTVTTSSTSPKVTTTTKKGTPPTHQPPVTTTTKKGTPPRHKGQLPRTGSNSTWGLRFGLATVLTGGFLAIVRRRRHWANN